MVMAKLAKLQGESTFFRGEFLSAAFERKDTASEYVGSETQWQIVQMHRHASVQVANRSVKQRSTEPKDAEARFSMEPSLG
jgi:hypothetical protein